MDAADRLEIHELAARYTHVLDNRLWDDLDKIFVNDVVIDSGPTLGMYVGIDEVHRFWSDYAHPTGHHAMCVMIEEERPDGTVKVITKGLFSREGGLNGGDYHDVVARTDDGWRFVSRTYTPRWKIEVAG